MPAQPEAGAPALVVEGVFAGYGGGDVLRGVSLQVVQGGITCVVGPNGAGKSTLLRAVSGLLRPRQGQIYLHGESIVGKSPREILKMGVVQVPQNHSLFREMTVRENINLGAYIVSRPAARRAQAGRGTGDVSRRSPTWLGQKAGSLSGGQQRLVEFARSPDARPDDGGARTSRRWAWRPRCSSRCFDAVRMMNAQGKTILLVEQNARAGLRLSTHGVVLENGLVRLLGHRQGGARAPGDRRPLPRRRGDHGRLGERGQSG